MKSYIISIVSVAILIALAELILPQGRLKNVVNTVFSLFLLIVIINPLNSIEESSIPTFNQEDVAKTIDVSYVYDYFDSKAEDYYASYYKNILFENDLIAESVIVKINNMKIDKIKIFLSNLVIPEENVHINNNVISLYVAEILGIEAEKVEVYA